MDKNKIFEIKTSEEFNDIAIEMFEYQYKNNPVYNRYVNLCGFKTNNIQTYCEIPFLPIELFRTKKIIIGSNQIETVFFSSGTTNKEKSKHYIQDLDIYKKSILKSFQKFIGDPKGYSFLCLIPDFENNPNSSLAFMASELISLSQQNYSGFYLNREKKLISTIKLLKEKNIKFILFGLSFALLDFAEKYKINLDQGLVIETGGTKKQKKHIIQQELHKKLKLLFNTPKVYSEYGMAELLSQSYHRDNCFESPPWKKIIIRDKTNPFKVLKDKKRGCINIIDLANINSCSFIATNDFGYLTSSGFNILGRSQNASERGCNLMI